MSAHHDHARGDHDHSHAHLHGSGKVLLYALLFTVAFAVVELLGGWWSHSLALLSDAGHMLTDSSSLGIGALAAWLARWPVSRMHSFGLQRAEVLGALVNAVLMIVVVGAIVATAIMRLGHPEPVAGLPVMVIALIGLGVNVAIAAVLMRGEQTMNVRGALLHVMGDMLGSVAALVAGVVILITGWMLIDPLLSLLVSVLIGFSALRLLREVLHVLMEGVPRGVDAAEVGEALAEVRGVCSVHDLHIWSLSSNRSALSAHIEVCDLSGWRKLLPELQQMLADRFAITHTTLQPEDTSAIRACATDNDCGLTAADHRSTHVHYHAVGQAR